MTVSLPATALSRAGSGPPEPDGPRWVDRLNRLLHREIRAAVADDILTSAEAEQLRARLVLVIDQAITPARPAEAFSGGISISE